MSVARDRAVRRRDRRRRQTSLLALNAALLVGLGWVTFQPRARAQSNRVAGSYIGVTGAANGVESDVVYILDTTNGEMIALYWDSNEKELRGIGRRDVNADARASVAGGGR